MTSLIGGVIIIPSLRWLISKNATVPRTHLTVDGEIKCIMIVFYYDINFNQFERNNDLQQK